MTHILTMVAQRLGLGLLSLFVVSLIIFLGVELLPGDLAQAILGQAATPETVAAFRKELGLETTYIPAADPALQTDIFPKTATS